MSEKGGPSYRRLVAVVIMLIAAGGIVFVLVTSQPGSRTNPHTIGSKTSVTSPQNSADVADEIKSKGEPVAGNSLVPKSSNIHLRAFAYFKNPYQSQEQLVHFKVTEVPIIVAEGTGVSFVYQSSRTGLRFNRMTAKRQALYDVMAINSESMSYEKQGELIVDIEPPEVIPDSSRGWQVIPEPVVEGTNGFGASISVPAVRFVRYDGER